MSELMALLPPMTMAEERERELAQARRVDEETLARVRAFLGGEPTQYEARPSDGGWRVRQVAGL